METINPMKYKLIEVMTISVAENYLKNNIFQVNVSSKLKDIVEELRDKTKDFKSTYENLHNETMKCVIVDDVAFKYNSCFIGYFKLK